MKRHVAVSLAADGSSAVLVAIAPATARTSFSLIPPKDGTLDLLAIEVFPAPGDLRPVVERTSKLIADNWHLAHGPGDWGLLVDVGHYLRGRSLGEAFRNSDLEKRWQIVPMRVEVDPKDLARPERAVWRVKLPRRDVVGGLMDVVGRDLLHVPRRLAHADDLKRQLETMKNRRAGDEDAPEELALALALAVWRATRGAPSLGGFLPRAAKSR